MSDEFTLYVKRFEPTDVRLGRHVVHDDRSLRYAFRAGPRRQLASVRHLVGIPIMDQGQVGSCTGHAGANVLASGDFWAIGREALQPDPHAFALGLYSEATALDPWPGQYTPDDTGSDGLSVAKALHGRGMIAGYRHALSLQDALAALAGQVVMVGTSWREPMFEPAADGQLTIDGPTAGGHEYALDELDVQRQRVWIRNSWGEGWGVQGRAWMTWAGLERLLADDGDCTVLVPLSAPAPQPTPAPAPTPAPPEPRPFPTQNEKNLAGALVKVLDNRNCPRYLKGPAEAWLRER